MLNNIASSFVKEDVAEQRAARYFSCLSASAPCRRRWAYFELNKRKKRKSSSLMRSFARMAIFEIVNSVFCAAGSIVCWVDWVVEKNSVAEADVFWLASFEEDLQASVYFCSGKKYLAEKRVVGTASCFSSGCFCIGSGIANHGRIDDVERNV